jgi:hypothetical protein
MKPSAKQKVVRERFTYKGSISRIKGMGLYLIESPYVTSEERNELCGVIATINYLLGICDNNSKQMVREAK